MSSIEQLKQFISQIGYKLNSCVYATPREMIKESTLMTRAFVQVASESSKNKNKKGYYSLVQLYESRWCEDEAIVLDFFVDNLDDNAKLEVLAFYTSYIHELTHHNDMMLTPLGVNYHSKLCREYLNFQDFGKKLLKNPDLIEPYKRIVDYDSEILGDLEGQIKYFEALFNVKGWGKFNIDRGWGSNTKPVLILNQEFEKVTIRGVFPSIIISEDNEYLTPIAIIECRALINCILWIYSNVGDTSDCKDVILLYLNIYRELDPQYTFILNLFARYFGCQNIQNLIGTISLDNLKQILFAINTCCWYALQAPPPTNDNSFYNSSPIVRLILSIKEFKNLFESKTSFTSTSILEFLNCVDRSPVALDLSIEPMLSVLNYCFNFLAYVKQLNLESNNDQQLRNHFNRIICIQSKQTSKRRNSEDPYSSRTALPDDGNLLYHINDEDLDDLLLDYVPGKVISNWFYDRSELLFGFPKDRKKILEILKVYFS